MRVIGVCSGEGTVELANKNIYRPAACEVQRGAKRWKANSCSPRHRQANIWWVCIERDAS